MQGIESRTQFEQILGDAERLANGLAARSDGSRQQLLQVLAQHLAYARATMADGRVPTAEQKAAVDLASVIRQLAPGPNGENTDPHTAWLHGTLPMLAAYYAGLAPPRAKEPPPVVEPPRAAEPPCTFEWGDQVCVPWPSGQRYLGLVRFVHEQSFLVAFPNGMQQWLQAPQLEPAPAPGQELLAMDAEGQRVTGKLSEFSAGRYQLDLGEGRCEWFEWTQVQPA